ncbi:hypothetical protein EPO44_09180 [bacterium]|nr:MAG: hypothetical protein EPO44_09180 [bacterium]
MIFPLLAFLSLAGLFRFLQSGASLRPWISSLLVSLPLALYLSPYLFFQLKTDSLIQFVAWARQSSSIDESTLKIASGMLVHLERQIVLALGVFLLLFLRRAGKLQEGLFAVLLVALVLLDLGSAHRSYQFPLDPRSVLSTPKIIEAPDREPYRLFYNHHLSNLHPSSYRFSPRPFPQTVTSVFALLIPNTGVFHGFDYMQELDALGRKGYDLFLKVANSLPPERLYRLLGALNVREIVSLQPLPPGGIALVRQLPEYPAWLYKIERVVPRAYIAPQVVVEKDPVKILQRLSNPTFDALREVILEHSISILKKDVFRAEAAILRYTNQEVTIRASLNSSGILVLADSFYPGWRVYVDGKEEEILRANFLFRGVLLPSGEHVVEFQYQPYWFKVGLVLSLVAASLLLFLILLNRFGRTWTDGSRS